MGIISLFGDLVADLNVKKYLEILKEGKGKRVGEGKKKKKIVLAPPGIEGEGIEGGKKKIVEKQSVVLDPKWLVEMMFNLITSLKNETRKAVTLAKFGIIPMKEFCRLLGGMGDGEEEGWFERVFRFLESFGVIHVLNRYSLLMGDDGGMGEGGETGNNRLSFSKNQDDEDAGGSKNVSSSFRVISKNSNRLSVKKPLAALGGKSGAKERGVVFIPFLLSWGGVDEEGVWGEDGGFGKYYRMDYRIFRFEFFFC